MGVIVAGLFSRSEWAEPLPAFITTYAGDTLWALAILLALVILFPDRQIVHQFWLTIVIAFSIEFSQLYQADWINTIRHTRLGGLILGFGFKWSDLICYTTGSLAGAAGIWIARRPAVSGSQKRPRSRNC
jgi:hypothetical protein